MYDIFGRVTKMTYTNSAGTEKESYTYSYDKNTNILTKEVVNNYPTSTTQQLHKGYVYDYNAYGELVTSSTTDYNDSQVETTQYTYDSAGNRTQKNTDGVVTGYTYNSLHQLIASAENQGETVLSQIEYVYDANGNQTSETNSVKNTVVENTYDPYNQLSSVKISENGTQILLQNNLYGSDGRRIRKSENSVDTNYFYNRDSLLYTTDASGNLNTFNLLGTEGQALTTARYNAGTESFYTYHKDLAGSVNSIVDSLSNVQGIYEYGDFGETEEYQTVSIANEICYTGAIYDESTGLYYLNSRYYDPITGRFISQDTYLGEDKEPDTWHLYAYCANNPINYVDPDGHAAAALALAGGYYAVSTGFAVGAIVSGPAGWIVLTAVVATVVIGGIVYKKVKAKKAATGYATKSKTNKKTVSKKEKTTDNKKKTNNKSGSKTKEKSTLDKIPSRLKKGNKVNLGKFTGRLNGKKGAKESGGWRIEKDNSGHGGSKWKLFDNKNNRIASLYEDGGIRGK